MHLQAQQLLVGLGENFKYHNSEGNNPNSHTICKHFNSCKLQGEKAYIKVATLL